MKLIDHYLITFSVRLLISVSNKNSQEKHLARRYQLDYVYYVMSQSKINNRRRFPRFY